MNLKGILAVMVFLVLIMTNLSLSGRADNVAPQLIPDARTWCDETALMPIEGIWEYPDDGVIVLIKRVNGNDYRYDITVLESDDSRLLPGIKIGLLTVTPDRKMYKLSQYSKIKGGVLTDLYDCAAELSQDGYSLKVTSPELKIKYRPTTLLPRFIKSLRIQIDRPGEKLPKGLLKIYPSFDGNGSTHLKPRSL